MIQLLMIVAIILIFTLYLFRKIRGEKSSLTHLLASKQAELDQLRASEEILQQEVHALEARFHHVIEDPLTKLLGWPLFEDRVRQGINESDKYQFNLAVIYIDINDFKMINEAMGYEAGDAVLNEVSKRLQICIRQVDSVSRISKDIFAVLLTQLGKPETAAVVSQRILESLMQPILVKEQKLYITASIGIAIYPADGTDTAILFRNADEALLIAKEKGAQHYQFYQEKNHVDSLRELKLSTGLKQDAFLGQCEIYYQPIIHAKDKSIFCMEASLYWRHPELGLIHSDELFNYIEKHDKTNSAAEWLIKSACQQFILWRNIGFRPELLGLSLSIRQFANTQFIYRISQILQDCEFKPEWLLLTIEENFSESEFEAVEKSFNMLKYQNIKLAANHFGSGLFSIQDLQRLTVNYLKLDKFIISDIEQNEKTVELIRSIALLAQSLSMQLIIQGVETEKQMQTLAALGCDLMQGQFLGEPAIAKGSGVILT